MRSIESPTCFSVQWMDPLTGEAIMTCKCLWKTPLGMEACSCLERCMFSFTVHNMEKNKDKKNNIHVHPILSGNAHFKSKQYISAIKSKFLLIFYLSSPPLEEGLK